MKKRDLFLNTLGIMSRDTWKDIKHCMHDKNPLLLGILKKKAYEAIPGANT